MDKITQYLRIKIEVMLYDIRNNSLYNANVYKYYVFLFAFETEYDTILIDIARMPKL